MKHSKRIAATLAAAVTLTSLTACSEGGNTPAVEQSQAVQSTQSQAASTTQSQAAQSTQSQAAQTTQSTPAVSEPVEKATTADEYKAKVVELLDQYLCVFMGDQTEFETLGLDPESSNYTSRLMDYMRQCSDKADGYMNELRALSPPDEMKAAHTELMKIADVLEVYQDMTKELANCDLEDEEALQRISEISDKYIQKSAELSANIDEEFWENNKWLSDGIMNGECVKRNATIASYTVKSKVLSADVSAKMLVNVMNMWITDRMNDGKNALGCKELSISFNDGKAVVISGDFTDEEKADASDTLFNILNDNLQPSQNGKAFAVIYLNEKGMAEAALYVEGMDSADGLELPDANAFKEGKWNWLNGIDGVAADGIVVGTYPKLTY